MSGFAEKMHLKEMAEEDICFAQRDRELIEALHRKKAQREGAESEAEQDVEKTEKAKSKRLTIVSGGQTGVDRAALDAAMEVGLATGGWCPSGRRALDGPIPERYPLRETPSSRYAQRTEWNVRDADATLILIRGELSGGTRLTAELAARYERPLLILDLGDMPPMSQLLGWLEENTVLVLNVAGPREEGAPGIGDQARTYLEGLFLELTPESAVDCG